MTTRARTLYLRGVPDSLLRAAKAEAARRGTTLTAFVLDAIERSLNTPDDGDASLAEDQRWFEQNRTRLLRRYEGEHLAIIDGKVVDHDEDFGPLADRVFARFGGRPIFMPRCDRTEREVSLRSPRRASR
jgi:hypothetical protein